MKLKDRLTAISTILFGVVFAVAATLVYVGYITSAERIIFQDQEKIALLTAIFYLEEDELSSREHEKVQQQFEMEIRASEVRIFNEANQIRFGTKEPDPVITPRILHRIRKNERFQFSVGDFYYTGFFYPDNQGNFAVVIKDDHSIFKSQANRLLIIIIAVFFVGITGIFVLSRYLSGVAYRPVKDVIKSVQEVNPAALPAIIPSPETKDEIEELVESYNALFMRIADNMAIQKNFINFVSHEFKTPLTAISGTLEVFAEKSRSEEEYREVAQKVLEYVGHIEEILNTMIVISRIRTDASGLKEEVRVDEVLWDTVEEISGRYKDASITMEQNIPSNRMELLNVSADRAQLKIAFYNILENAAKYASGQPVRIAFFDEDGKLKIEIADSGPGIAPEDLENVTKPFYRGKNARQQPGSGIGLSLTEIIFRQNNIDFSIESELGKGTRFQLFFA